MKNLNQIELNNLRKVVDDLDSKIIKLLEDRLQASCMIGEIKKQLDIPTFTPEREGEIKRSIFHLIEDVKKRERILRIYDSILSESRAVQNDFNKEK